LIFEERALTFRELEIHVAALATALSARGLEKGQRVGLLLRKSPEAVIAFLGVTACGGLPVPLASEHPVPETQSVLDLTTPAALIAHRAFDALIADLRVSGGRDRVLLIDEAHAQPGASWWGVPARDDARIPDAGVTGEDAAYLNFTSGSLGVPKAA